MKTFWFCLNSVLLEYSIQTYLDYLYLLFPFLCNIWYVEGLHLLLCSLFLSAFEKLLVFYELFTALLPTLKVFFHFTVSPFFLAYIKEHVH